jgi:hypothetical protein
MKFLEFGVIFPKKKVSCMRQFKLDLILNDEYSKVIDTWSGNIGTIIENEV